HGAGSFGHILAKRSSLKNPEKGPELTVHIAKVQRDVRELNLLLLKSLIYRGIPAVPVPPSICARLDDGKLRGFDTGIFKRFLEIGNVPVTFGDVVLDRTRGVSILSGDTIMERLAHEFHPDKAVFVLDVNGFFDRSPDEEGARLYRELTVEELENILALEPAGSKTSNGVADITGGMRGKMESALRIACTGTDTYLVNGRVKGRLMDVSMDRPTISTKIRGEKL
ncbi:MAG: kinase, partial [Thermoplasmata archaeon]|nr:kinase [Thermoplasmata archaeon]